MNTIITNFYQSGESTLRLSCLIDLLVQIIEEPLFDNLRTKEQLGYDISVCARDNYGNLGYSITVNSQESRNKAEDVEARIEHFREKFLTVLTRKFTDEFEQAKESLIKLKQMKDTKLKDEVNRNWAEITTIEYIFDRHDLEVEMIRKITLEELIVFYTNSIERPRKLSVQVIGTTNPKKETDHEEVVGELVIELTPSSDLIKRQLEIDNIPQFKKTLIRCPYTLTRLRDN